MNRNAKLFAFLEKTIEKTPPQIVLSFFTAHDFSYVEIAYFYSKEGVLLIFVFSLTHVHGILLVSLR
jgi:hypothetical protein